MYFPARQCTGPHIYQNKKMASSKENSDAPFSSTKPGSKSYRAPLGCNFKTIEETKSIAQKYQTPKNCYSRRIVQHPSIHPDESCRISTTALKALKDSKSLNTKY